MDDETMAGAAVEGDLVRGAVVGAELVTSAEVSDGVVRSRIHRRTPSGLVLVAETTLEAPDEVVEPVAEVIPFPVYRSVPPPPAGPALAVACLDAEAA